MEKAPEVGPGAFSVVGCGVDLGDELEAAHLDADRVGLIDGDSSANDLCDEVVAGPYDPEVSSLINCYSTAGVEVGRVLLEASCGWKNVRAKEADFAETGGAAVGNPRVRTTIDRDTRWAGDTCRCTAEIGPIGG